MAITLYVLAVLLWAFGGMGYLTSDTVMQQQVGALLGISGSVLFIGGAIVTAVEHMETTMKAGIIAAVQEMKGTPTKGGAQKD